MAYCFCSCFCGKKKTIKTIRTQYISPPLNPIKNEGMRPDGTIDPGVAPIRMRTAVPKRKSLEIPEEVRMKVDQK
jgi:hypothetical protein